MRLLRRATTIAATAVLVTATVATAQPAEQAGERADRLDLYTAEVDADVVGELRLDGYDLVDVRPVDDGSGRIAVDVVTSGARAAALGARGVDLEAVRDRAGRTSSAAAAAEAAEGFEVWRSWSEDGGIADELGELATTYPDLLELSVIGQSVQGQDIVAVRLTGDVTDTPEGERPQVLYSSMQHAREWITVETNRRLLRHLVEGYGNDDEVTQVVDTTELWFVVVANPDGYDWTFTDGNRLWRKNLAENDGDGEITFRDGVDLNRNFPTKWGYDDEGSSPDPSSEVYRGPAPASEPETRALDALFEAQDFVFQVNWHSAAELLLYGLGWQVATPTPDDVINVAIHGTDDNPAVAGYDPDVGAELYTTNGETNAHAIAAHGVLGYTPELDTCESAEDIFPDDAIDDGWCEAEGRSVFEFPDDEALVQAVFEKNLPYALSIARSAGDPDDPATAATTGIDTPDLVIDPFDVGHGEDQQVAVTAKRALTNLVMHWKVNGGDRRSVEASEWDGGERYGDTHDTWYAEFRGTTSGAEPGDRVQVWFTARHPGGDGSPARWVRSDRFTYTRADVQDADVLVVAEEDYDGFSPQQAATAPQFADEHVDALAANDLSSNVWDVTAQGVPHHLGVLSHYDAVVWELGDNRLTQEAEDVEVATPDGPVREFSVSESRQFLTIALRDYLNEGGKLLHAGEYAAYFGVFGTGLGGVVYAANGDESAPCVIETSISDCLIHSDDFMQYYLGVFERDSFFRVPDRVSGAGEPFEGLQVLVDGAEVAESGALEPTSEALPVDAFPQFASATSLTYDSPTRPLASAAVTTEDSVTLGFGLEAVATADQRAELVGAAMEHLLGTG